MSFLPINIGQACHYLYVQIAQVLSYIPQKVSAIADAIFSSIRPSTAKRPLDVARMRLLESQEGDQTKQTQKKNENPAKPKPSVAERLKKNLDFAENDRKNEKARNFQLMELEELERLKESEKNLKEKLEEDYSLEEAEIFTERAKELFSLKDLTLSDFKIDDEEETVHAGRVVGVAKTQGRCPEMRNTHLATSLSFNVQSQSYEAGVLGIFDGHRGLEARKIAAAKFVQENLPTYLERALETHNRTELTDEGIFLALKECFQKLGNDYSNNYDGTTATTALILNGSLWVATLGISRAVLSNNGTPIQLSEDAKPSKERYKKKIEKLSGDVFHGWVNGNVRTARAIGDAYVRGIQHVPRYKELDRLISPKPKITRYSLNEIENGYLVLAGPGLYDVASTNEVVAAVNQMARENQSVQQMSHQLVETALRNKSYENISVMVVKL